MPRGCRQLRLPSKVVLPTRVVDHVDALAAGEALDLGLEVLLGVENHVGGAGFARELGLCLGGDGGDDARADARCDLREQQADTAGAGVHQRGVARLERVGGVSEIMRGHALEHGGGGVLQAQAVGNLDQLRGGNESVLGIAADDAGGGDRIAGFESRDAGTELLHGARGFAARNQGERGLVDALAKVDLDEVDAGGLNADEHLARPWLRNGQVDKLQRLQARRSTESGWLS